LSTDLVTDGLAFHDEIEVAVARNGPPPYSLHVLGGKRQPTEQSIAIRDGTIHYLRSQRGEDHLGDGTVPTFSAVPPELEEMARATWHAVRHGRLPNVPDVLDTVGDWIRSGHLAQILTPPCELGLDIPEIVEAGAGRIPVRVTADRGDLLLHSRLRDPSGDDLDPAPLAEAQLVPDGTGCYAVDLPAAPGVWRVEVTAVAQQPPTMIDDLVVVLDHAAER
jgi:hypothetical protein